jgi:hypothetical protein
VAYLWLMATALRVAFRVSQAARDRLLRVTGTTLFATFVGIILIEATATFTGANLRFTVVAAALVGWLAAAEHLLREEREVRPGSG